MSAHYETGLFSGYPSINRWQQHQKHLTILLYFDNNHWQTFYRHWRNTVVTFWWIRIFDVIIDAAQQRKKNTLFVQLSTAKKKRAIFVCWLYRIIYTYENSATTATKTTTQKREWNIYINIIMTSVARLWIFNTLYTCTFIYVHIRVYAICNVHKTCKKEKKTATDDETFSANFVLLAAVVVVGIVGAILGRNATSRNEMKVRRAKMNTKKPCVRALWTKRSAKPCAVYPQNVTSGFAVRDICVPSMW